MPARARPLAPLLLLLLSVGSAAVAEDAPKDASKESAAAESASEPETAVATKGPFSAELEAAGSFVPTGAVPVAYRPRAYGGELDVVEVGPLGPVEAGALLVRFDTEKIDEQIRAATAELAVAREGLARATEEQALAAEAVAVGRDRAEFDAKRADEAHRHFRDVEAPLRRLESEHRLQGARDNVQDQEEELAQLEKMYGADELTEETEEIVLKRARRQLERSKTNLGFLLQRQRALFEIELPREEAHLDLSRRKTQNDWQRTLATADLSLLQGRLELEKAKAALERQTAALGRLEADRAAMTVVSPAAGFAVAGTFWNGKWHGLDDLAKALVPGRRAPAHQTLFTVFPAGALRVRATVPEAVVFRVRPGAAAKAVPGADLSTSVGARVAQVAAVSGDGQYEVVLDLDRADPRWMPGQGCKVSVVLEAREVVTVPTPALRKDGEKWVLHLWQDGKAVPKEVKVGGAAGGRTEVLEGVEPGAAVLATAPPK
jgi:hypothetical protein